MQTVYAWTLSEETPESIYDIMLKDFIEEIRLSEKEKGESGDAKLAKVLYEETIKNREEFDQLIQSKADNWELDRIALLDRILMQLGICEMLHFEEIPIKVTINEYLEIAKKYSTPKSSKFINGILDSLYTAFRESDRIKKSGRGLVESSKRQPPRQEHSRPSEEEKSGKRKRKRIVRNNPPS